MSRKLRTETMVDALSEKLDEYYDETFFHDAVKKVKVSAYPNTKSNSAYDAVVSIEEKTQDGSIVHECVTSVCAGTAQQYSEIEIGTMMAQQLKPEIDDVWCATSPTHECAWCGEEQALDHDIGNEAWCDSCGTVRPHDPL